MSRDPLAFAGLDADLAELARAADELLTRTPRRDLAETGWAGIGIAESAGGSGGSGADAAPVVEALGAHLSPALAGWQALVVAPAIGAAAPDLVRAIAAGETELAVPVESAWHCAAATTGTTRLQARLRVLGGGGAGMVLPFRLDGAEVIAVVPVPHPAVRVVPLAGLDPTRPLAEVTIADLPVADLLALSTGCGFPEWTGRVGVVCALDAVGAARTAFAQLLGHATTRRQFGREIGSFQAYKHRCAQAYVEFKLAQSLAFRAAAHLDEPRLALAAATYSPGRATFVAGEAVQLHGGIGFTWEAQLHAMLKRARADEIIATAGGHAARELMKESA